MSHSLTQRWQKRTTNGHEPQSLEEVAGFLLTRVAEPTPLSATTVFRLRSQSLLGIERQNFRRSIFRGLATAGLPLAFSLAFAAAFHWGGRSLPIPIAPPVLGSAGLAGSVPTPIAPAGIQTESPPTGVLQTPKPKKARTVAAHRSPASLPREPKVVAPVPAPTSPGPAALEQPLPDETSQIGQALQQLRRDHDPGGALATLVIYRLRYPQGTLRDEAATLELDADMALGNRAEALALLDRMLEQSRSDDLPRIAEWRLLRAELLAQEDRCPEALPTFDRLLTLGAVPSLRERALFGRASCRARSGEPEGSRSDLYQYLREFPQGTFAASARQSLERQP